MKILILLLFFAVTASADEFRIPYECWPRELRREFAAEGKKVDLSGSDRTQESWGFIENKGDKFVIYTYRSINSDDLALIMNIVNKVENQMRGDK